MENDVVRRVYVKTRSFALGLARNDRLRVVVAQLFGQVALLASIPLLARQLSMGEMGLYQSAFALSVVLQPLATLRRELTVPVCTPSSVRRDRSVGLGVAALFCASLLLAGLVLHLSSHRNLGAILMSAGLITFSLSLIYVENAVLIRSNLTGRLAVRNLVGGVLAGVMQVVFAALFPSAVGISAALLAGRAMATLATLARLPTVAEEVSVSAMPRPRARSITSVLSAMTASASSQVVVLLSAASLGASAAAQVALGQRVAGAPASLVGQAVTQLALAEAAPLIRESEPGIVQVLSRHTRLVGGAALAVGAMIAITAPWTTGVLLGSSYASSWPMVSIFALPLSLTLLALPATYLMIPLGLSNQLFFLQLLRLVIVSLVVVSVAFISADITSVALGGALAWSLAYVPLLWAAFHGASAHDRACERST